MCLETRSGIDFLFSCLNFVGLCHVVVYDKKAIFGFASHFWHRAPETLGAKSHKGHLVPGDVPLAVTPAITVTPVPFVKLLRVEAGRRWTNVG